jgi:hypothetical protein
MKKLLFGLYFRTKRHPDYPELPLKCLKNKEEIRTFVKKSGFLTVLIQMAVTGIYVRPVTVTMTVIYKIESISYKERFRLV